MDFALVKFLIVLILCQYIGMATSSNLKYSRLKRSPDNFSLFGVKSPFSLSNPIKTAQESLNSFGNIFSSRQQNRDRNQRPIEYQSFTNNMKATNDGHTNTLSPMSDSYKNSIPNFMNRFNNKNVVQQKEKYKLDSEGAAANNQAVNEKSDTKTGLVNDANKINKHQEEQEVVKQIIDYIFQMTPDNSIDNIESTTIEAAMDYTTETGDYETTTMDGLGERIAAPVVASLLG